MPTPEEHRDDAEANPDAIWVELLALAKRTAVRLVPSVAVDDVCAEAVLGSVACARRGATDVSLVAGMRTITRRSAARWLEDRKRAPVAYGDLDDVEAPAGDPRGHARAVWFRDEFLRRLRPRLTGAQRAVLREIRIEQTTKGAARILGMAAVDVRSAVRAMASKGVVLAIAYRPPDGGE